MENKVELFTSNESFLIQQICAILKDNKIRYVLKSKGAGEYINIVWGETIEETSIIIDEENFSKANELISNFTSGDKVELSEDEENEAKKYHNMKKWIIILFTFLPIIIFFIALITVGIFDI